MLFVCNEWGFWHYTFLGCKKKKTTTTRHTEQMVFSRSEHILFFSHWESLIKIWTATILMYERPTKLHCLYSNALYQQVNLVKFEAFPGRSLSLNRFSIKVNKKSVCCYVFGMFVFHKFSVSAQSKILRIHANTFWFDLY